MKNEWVTTSSVIDVPMTYQIRKRLNTIFPELSKIIPFGLSVALLHIVYIWFCLHLSDDFLSKYYPRMIILPRYMNTYSISSNILHISSRNISVEINDSIGRELHMYRSYDKLITHIFVDSVLSLIVWYSILSQQQ